MIRLIEIYNQDGLKKLDTTSLPLVIGTTDSAHLHVEGHYGTLAYVAESSNHLFLQPASTSAGINIFHNDETLVHSVWLKSGDVTRFGDILIHWHFSGERVEIRVSHISAEPLIPPAAPPEPNRQVDDDQEDGEERTNTETLVHSKSRNTIRIRNLIMVMFVLLIAGAGFVLLARPLEITIRPSPDRLEVSGFPLVIKFGANYLGLPGEYQLFAEKDGYEPLEQTVLISGDDNRYEFELEKLSGILNVITNPPGVLLLVDGQEMGKTPLTGIKVRAGTRKLEFKHPRYLLHQESLVIQGLGKKQKIEISLKPAWASVSFQSEPSGATVFIDGEEKGITPVALNILNGRRKLLLREEGYSTFETEIEVVAGQDQVLPLYTLQQAPAAIKLTSEPNGAMVAVDNQYKGQTPIVLHLAPDVLHSIRLSSAGYVPRNRNLKFTPGEADTLHFKLSPEIGVIFVVTDPPNATLFIDGQKQTQSIGRFQLSTRPHTLEVRAKGYVTTNRVVTPQAELSQRIEISLAHEQDTGSSIPAKKPGGKITTSLGQKLILIEAGLFRMGASRNEPGRRANELEHDVELKKSFYMTEHEVTNGEYRQFHAEHSSGVVGNRSLEGDDQPVVNVTWDDAVQFMNWLSQKEGLTPYYQDIGGKMVVMDKNGPGYRLPTEAEWAYAARMAKRTERARYSWPGSYPPKNKAGNYADESARHILPVVIEGYNDGFPVTAPVRSFVSNPAGLYDIDGNVAEWCHDFYAANPGASTKNTVDPMGPANGTHHVVRGASWRDASITELRLSYRRYSRESANDIGFRIVRSAQ